MRERGVVGRGGLLGSGAVAVLFAGAAAAGAQEPAGQGGAKSAAEIAEELANPNNSLGALALNLDYRQYAGALPGSGEEQGFVLAFQPSLPVPLGSGVNFFLRPQIPVVLRQPLPLATGGFESTGAQLGNIGFDAAVGKGFSNGLLVIGGVVGSAPTASHDALGGSSWTLGPEAVLGVVKKWGSVAVLVTQSWNLGGDGPTNVTGGQYFYTINLKSGWQIAATPTYSYNHEAPEGNRFSFPVGAGLSKTTILGSTPWKFALQYWYYVARPDAFAVRHQVRFSVTAVVPLPW